MSHQERRRRQAVLVGLVLLALCVMERVAVPQLMTSAPVTTESNAGSPRSAQTKEATTLRQFDKGDEPNVVRSIQLARLHGGVEVHIEGDRPLTTQSTTLTNPERLVVDLVNVHPGRTLQIPVNAGDVQRVRVGWYREDPPTARIVLDLVRAHPYHLLSSGNTLIVRVDGKEKKTFEVQPVPRPRRSVVRQTSVRRATSDDKPALKAIAGPEKATHLKAVQMLPLGAASKIGAGEVPFADEAKRAADEAEPNKITRVEPAQPPPSGKTPQVSSGGATFGNRSAVTNDAEPTKADNLQTAKMPPPSTVSEDSPGEAILSNKPTAPTHVEPEETGKAKPAGPTELGDVPQVNSPDGSEGMHHSGVESTGPQEVTPPPQAAKADQPAVVRGLAVLPAQIGMKAEIDGSERSRNDQFLIGADDVLAVNVWKEPEISRAVPVRSDGKISLPLVGELAASGRTPQELQDEISKKLQAYMSEPEVTVIVQQIKSQHFNILGQVAKPGSYPLTKPMTVVDAIAVAGGFRDFAKQKKIYVLRHNPDGREIRIPFNYKEVIKGKSPDRLEVESHDTIVVP